MNAIAQLNDKRFNGYLRRRLPHELDEVVDSVVEAYRTASGPARTAMLEAVNPRVAGVLSAYGQRAAATAVRTRSQDALRRGLVAMGMADSALADSRDNLYGLAAVDHSASLLGTELGRLLDDVAAELPGPALASLRDFARRDAKDRSLRSMGLAAKGSGEDFRYVPGSTQEG